MTLACDPRTPTLLFRGRDIVLADGRYVVGRSPICQLVIDDASVSRRHAQIEVFGENVTIVDLASSNGVQVNDRTISVGPHPLRHGDVIRIGSEALHFRFTSTPRRDSRSPPPTLADARGGPRTSEPPTSTRLTGGAQLVLGIGERALEAGNPREAEAVARDYLDNVRKAARQLRPEAPGTYSQVTSFALRLARATGRGEWLDFALEILRLRRVPCSDALADRLREVVAAVDSVKLKAFEDWATALRSGPHDLEALRGLQQLEGLIRLATAKRRTGPGR